MIHSQTDSGYCCGYRSSSGSGSGSAHGCHHPAAVAEPIVDPSCLALLGLATLLLAGHTRNPEAHAHSPGRRSRAAALAPRSHEAGHRSHEAGHRSRAAGRRTHAAGHILRSRAGAGRRSRGEGHIRRNRVPGLLTSQADQPPLPRGLEPHAERLHAQRSFGRPGTSPFFYACLSPHSPACRKSPCHSRATCRPFS